MNRITKLTTAVVLLLVTSQTYADTRTVIGAGFNTCEIWTESRQGNDLVLRTAVMSWAQGYISGVNTTNLQSIDILKDNGDYEDWFTWIDNYCKANPLDTISAATARLTHELSIRKKTQQ